MVATNYFMSCHIFAALVPNLITKATAQIVENPQGVCDLLNRIGGEGTAERIGPIVAPTVGSSIREAFVVTSKDVDFLLPAPIVPG